ncbi:hypothetical protein B0T17DRAFT_46228 [Bombardia bombarda]|uniref:Uncharacterized protein n=1 Tax=Bombardia bombarda TaxID=252184 RepID=A0AA39XM23_9PEZI|nr:hypothetical protein B0T17DRAFT_46228 [Bombardia bombarda]
MSKQTSLVQYLAYAGIALSNGVLSSSIVSRQANGAVDTSVFLRRAYHSSAVFDGWVYVDGGDFSYLHNNGSVVYQYSDTLIAIDLSKDWTNGSVLLHSNSKPSGAPSLESGGIWVDDKGGVLYTGFAGSSSVFGDGASYPQGLWSITPDGKGGGSWQNLNGSTDSDFTDQPRASKVSVASSAGSGFSLSGFFGNSSSLQQIPFGGIFSYDFSSKTTSGPNFSGGPNSAGGGGGFRQSGGLIYTPNFGNKGILVSIGGDQSSSNGVPGGGSGSNNNGISTSDLASFSSVQIYDVNSQNWYDQKTSGSIPTSRKDFCMTGVASASDSTYDILVYAGWDGNRGSSSVHFDEAFVLTLPGFNWVQANYTARHPRYGLTCHSLGGGQALTVGGVDPTQKGTNGEDPFKAGFDTPDPFVQGLAVFDLSGLAWKASYSSKQAAGSYTPAPAVMDYYDAHGRTPLAGFSSSSLQSIITTQDFSPSAGDNDDDDSSSSSSSSSRRAGTIAGGVLGGLAGIASAGGLLLYLARRRKRRQNQDRMHTLAAEGGDRSASHPYPFSPSGFYNLPRRGRRGGGDDDNVDAANAMAMADMAPPPSYAVAAATHGHGGNEKGSGAGPEMGSGSPSSSSSSSSSGMVHEAPGGRENQIHELAPPTPQAQPQAAQPDPRVSGMTQLSGVTGLSGSTQLSGTGATELPVGGDRYELP